MHRPLALDICAGAGGLSEGLCRAGFRVRGVELDADACDTHRRHVGPCDRADVRTYLPPSATLVAGGVPCQPFSQAGDQRGLDDPRYLVPDLLRIARMAGAKAVLLENVRGLVRMPRAFRVVLDAFEAEWHTVWTVLDSADQGVPQNRDRVFVVGFRDAIARARFKWPDLTHWPAAKLDGPRERLPGDKRGRRTPGTLGLFDTHYRTVRQALNLGGEPYRSGRQETAAENSYNGHRMLNVDAPAPSVTSRTNTELLSRLDEPAPCISAGGTGAGGGAEPIANAKSRRELLAEIEAAGLADRPATTVQGDPRLSVAGHHDIRSGQQRSAVRLTVAQCAALQGFPPDWTFTGDKRSQHRQIGNAVPPGLGEAIGRSILSALAG